jgi:hypothetical protein
MCTAPNNCTQRDQGTNGNPTPTVDMTGMPVDSPIEEQPQNLPVVTFDFHSIVGTISNIQPTKMNT